MFNDLIDEVGDISDSMEDYKTLSKIGDGTFGTVYLCRKRSCSTATAVQDLEASNKSSSKSCQSEDDKNSLVAIKKMKKRYHNWDECMQLREIKALKQLNHQNIVLLQEVIREEDNLYLVFEYMEENLYQLMRRQVVPFTESTIKSIIKQVTNGLAFVHKHGYFHRDIKPENLLCRNGTESIKIADFGLTREICSKPPYTEYVSTRWYRAPELLLHSTDYGWPIDIWAVGCIAGELYTLRPMFPGRSEIDQLFKICQVLGKPDLETWQEGEKLASLVQLNLPNVVPLKLTQVLTSCSETGIDFIGSTLKWSPKCRPKAIDLLSHNHLRD